MTHLELTDLFDLVPVTRAQDPCHYAFCLPNGHAFDRWPAFPAAARPAAGRVAAGRGTDAAQCRESALGEAVELACACDWGDEKLLHTTRRELGEAAVDPAALTGFSTRQYAQRGAWNSSALGALDWCPAPCDDTRAIDWIDAVTSTGERCFVPADFALVGRRAPGDPDAVAIATTSGCASAHTAKAARSAALLEVIERDAVGHWWYARRAAAALDGAGARLPAEVRAYIDRRTRQTRLLRLHSSTGIPVVAALSHDADGGALALGFACGFDVDGAAASAVTEMFQTEIALVQRQRQEDPLLRIWLREARIDRLPPVQREAPAPAPAPVDLADITARLGREGKTCCFLDLARPGFGRAVARAIVTEMWSDKPRFRGFDRTGAAAPSQVLPLLI